MLRLDKVIKPWKESAALNDHINLYGFWNETTFLTKSGDVGMVLSISGVDYESLDRSEQEYAVKRLEAALKAFGLGFHVYALKQMERIEKPRIRLVAGRLGVQKGALLRKHGHLEDHHGKNRRLSSSQTPTSNCETRQAAGTQHHAPRNRDAAPDLEDRAVPRMARPASRFL